MEALYFKSLNRHFQVMGVERQLFFLLLGLCLPMAYSAKFNIEVDCLALIIFIVGCIAGIFMARSDAQFMPIYLRHIRYRKYYAPFAGIHAAIRLVKPSVPIYQGKTGLI